MACYYPLRLESSRYAKLVVACGQCVGCRLERSAQWATRILHEAQCHEQNCFITLTYNVQCLPADGSLVYEHFQLFMRSLRKRTRLKVRFFMCGEYGDEKGRPHFHACVFGYDFPDKVYYRKSPSGHTLFRSAFLDAVWGRGLCSIGALNFESAAYVARYVMKKRTGDGEDCYYQIVDPETGELNPRRKEFCHMSLKPGIGRLWYDKYAGDIRDGAVVVNGVERSAPKYYMRRLKLDKPEKYAAVVEKRFERSLQTQAVIDRQPARLAVRERVTNARIRSLKRVL